MALTVTNTDYVFCTADGQPYSNSTLNRYFVLAKKLAKITRRCRLNDLRHTFGSNLASEGVSLIEIRDALGHTSTRTTERYAKPDGRSLERVREALNRREKRGNVDTTSSQKNPIRGGANEPRIEKGLVLPPNLFRGDLSRRVLDADRYRTRGHARLMYEPTHSSGFVGTARSGRSTRFRR